MGQEAKSGTSKWIWIVVAVVVIVGGVLAWYFLMGPGKKSDSSSTATTTAVTKKHADWATYTSAKYAFKINYPTTYTTQITGDGSVKFLLAGKTIAEIYSTSGGSDAEITASVNLHTDDTKGYMTGGIAKNITVAGVSGKQIAGTFGKNAGISMNANDGIKGSSTIFAKNSRTFYANSYDNADATAKSNFDDMLAELTF